MNAPGSIDETPPVPAPAIPDRRASTPRTTTVLMTGKLIQADRESLCRVRNISANGMMIETLAVLAVDQKVSVALRHGGEIGARIAWTRGGAAGLQFFEAIDVKTRLAPAPPPQSRLTRQHTPRGPRLLALCEIEMEARGVTYDTVMLNISQGGARVRLPFRAAPDERLVLSIAGLPLKSGAVRWSRGIEAGLGFYEALPFDMLAEWAEALGDTVPATRDGVPGLRDMRLSR